MRILIVGAGGVGGFFGARLIQAGADVTYLLRPARRALIERQGLVIETPQGSFTVRPQTVLAEELTPDYDLIVLSPKAYDLDNALTSIAGASARGVLVPVLNGLAHMRVLDARFGRARVMGGVAHIVATIADNGAVRQLTPLAVLTVGPRDPAHEAVAREFFRLCQAAQFDSRYTETIEQALWDKWTFLAALAGATTLCRGAVGDIVATEHGAALITAMHDECLAVASACGFGVAEAVSAVSVARLTEAGSPMNSSMLRDLLGGSRTEHEHILGEMVRLAAAKEVPCPLLQAALTHMRVETRLPAPQA